MCTHTYTDVYVHVCLYVNLNVHVEGYCAASATLHHVVKLFGLKRTHAVGTCKGTQKPITVEELASTDG